MGVEVQFVTQDYDGVCYHLVSNPDAPDDKYNYGATLYWSEAPEWKASGHFLIPKEKLRDVADMLNRAADIAGV